MPKMSNSKHMHYRDVIVIGAGASGLMAAIAAARRGASVVVLNHHSVPGKKILSTGNGQCNFTNERQDPECYRSDNPELVAEALRQFSKDDTLAFFREIGVYAKCKNGYYYPMSAQAVTVRDALLAEAENLHVQIENDIEIVDVSVHQGIFRVELRTEEYEARRCILATGGKAAPKTGSDGSGYLYAIGLGHKVVNPLPALVPLLCRERWIRRTAGVRCDGQVTLYVDGEVVAADQGELQFTDMGISGIPVFQVSRYAVIALDKKQRVEAVLDFFPEDTEQELADRLMDMADRLGNYKNWYQILGGICNQKIAAMLCEKLKLDYVPAHQFSRETGCKQAAALARELKHTVVPITGSAYVERAQTTCGGVTLTEIGPDMQSQRVPGLYFAGEIMNVDGICGGYNLQWAWTSGYLAGSHAAGEETPSPSEKDSGNHEGE